jgi:glycine dehydrogenase subunit 1
MKHPYLPLTEEDRRQMLTTIGVSDFDELIADIPKSVRLQSPLNLPRPQTEMELRSAFQNLAGQNHPPQLSFLGAGAYQHYIPSVVGHLAKRSEFYTAYTPYQPEISQGMLQAIFEYQTYVSELFGLPIANASLYDGPTALVEAVIIALRETRRPKVLIPANLHPNLTSVLQTYLRNLPAELVQVAIIDGVIDLTDLTAKLDSNTAAMVVPNPNFFGLLEELPAIFDKVKAQNAIPICYAQPVPLGVLASPGKLGAEIVVGEGQPLGISVAYGGPYLGMMAVSERFMRRIPGRVVGESVDHDGRRAFVLTLQTREQHIRREKATSNICSNEALCALQAAIHLSVLGPVGLAEVARRCLDNAHYLYGKLLEIGLKPLSNRPFFMEFAVVTPRPASYYIEALSAKGINPGYDLGSFDPSLQNALLCCATEVFSKTQLDRFVTEMRDLL